jgi:hypothetical protein
LNWKLSPPKEKKRAPLNIRVRLLKRRRRKVKVDPKPGGQWKEKEKVIFYLFHFSPKQLYLNLHFLSFTLRFYFALVLGHYLRPPFVFLGL